MKCLLGFITLFPTPTFVIISPNSSLTLLPDTKMPSSSGDATAELTIPRNPVDDRKRKGKEKELECDNKLESAEAKQRGHGSTKRSRVAEVHNQSERRRRDRINQKLKALQELIPCSNKLDKASVLEEAIKYLKSLQMQIQMMSMVYYNMVPVMFPGMQQNVPLMVNPQTLPFPNVLTAATTMAVGSGTSHLGPSFVMPPYQILPRTSPNSSTTQSTCVSKC